MTEVTIYRAARVLDCGELPSVGSLDLSLAVEGLVQVGKFETDRSYFSLDDIKENLPADAPSGSYVAITYGSYGSPTLFTVERVESLTLTEVKEA